MRYCFGIMSVLLSLGLLGCASSNKDVSNATDSTAENAEGGAAAQANAGSSEATSASQASSSGTTAVKNNAPEVAPQCKDAVANFVRKTNGDLQVLTVDGTLHMIKTGGDVGVENRLADGVDNYMLLPADDVVVHFKSGENIMLESSTKGIELLRLAGDPRKKQIYFNSNMTEIAVEKSDGVFSIWNIARGIHGAAENERFQDYVNRQSADHNIGFPGDVTALAISTNNHIFVGLNDSGISGRLYHFDPDAIDPETPAPPPEPAPEPEPVKGKKDKKDKKAKKGKVTKTGNENHAVSVYRRKGVLLNMVRTNSQIVDISISANMKYVAVVDDKGEAFFTPVDSPSFITFGEKYTDVKKVLFNGDNPIIVRRSTVTAVDSQNKSVVFDLGESYDSCAVSSGDLYCSKNGYFDIMSASNGKLKARYVFKGDKYGVIKDGTPAGTLDSSCYK